MVTFISVGEDHASAINMNGELYCWGRNDDGQCGTAVCQGIFRPVIPMEDKITLCASGGKHTMALTSDNSVFAWGSNYFGQLGLSLDETDSFEDPRELFYFKEKIVSWLSAGSNHSVALTIEGYGYVWGRNDLG